MHLRSYSQLLVLFIGLVFVPIIGNCQNFSIDVTGSSFNIGTIQHKGYKTTFTEPNEDIKKAWWRYIKSKAYIFNHKTHYELKIPSKRTEQKVVLVSKLSSDNTKRATTLHIAISQEIKLTKQEKSEFNADIKALLIDFKVSYYTEILQYNIKEQEKKISTIGKQISKIPRDRTKQLETLKSRLDSETNKLDYLKHQLQLIK